MSLTPFRTRMPRGGIKCHRIVADDGCYASNARSGAIKGHGAYRGNVALLRLRCRGEDKVGRPWHHRVMRQLLLLRHAKSSWDDASLSDKDRPLNQRGHAAAATMRRAIRDLGLVPDLIMASTARRTLQTLEALEPWDETPLIEPHDSLYLADPARILAALHSVAETVRSVMVIGHNPGLHDLALLLVGTKAIDDASPAVSALTEGFPTCALAEFTIAGSWWDLRAGGGHLVRFLTPRMLSAGG